MFGLFKSKARSKSVKYHMYRTEVTKYRLLVEEIRKFFDETKHVIVLCFFEETYEQLRQLSEASKIVAGDYDTKFTLSMAGSDDWKHHGLDAQIILAELYPLSDLIAEVLLEYKGDREVIGYVSADNAMFEIISGGQLLSLLDRLGVGESEVINHGMIDKIINATQKKMSEKVLNTKSARSLEEWLTINKGASA